MTAELKQGAQSNCILKLLCATSKNKKVSKFNVLNPNKLVVYLSDNEVSFAIFINATYIIFATSSMISIVTASGSSPGR